MFSRKDLVRLIVPLIIEQLLAVTVGMVGTIMVSGAGESAVSGVSLVDSINILLITVFASLATGGAVVVAQYIGQKNKERACEAADQLLLAGGIISIIIMAFALIGNSTILRLVFGNVDQSIMDNAVAYFLITALSYPFLAIYNSSAALFRAMGNSKISMYVSLVMNIINIVGNVIFIYGFSMGAAGVAWSATISRAVAAVIMYVLLRNEKNPVHYARRVILRFDRNLIRRILAIGVPNSLENGMFQVGKILVLSLTTSFGSVAIAANAVSNTIAAFACLPGSAMGLALITVVGQCVGANDYKQARKYTKQLLSASYVIMGALNLLILAATPFIVSWFSLSTETASVTRWIIMYHSICCMIIWPASFTLPNALRAANDVKFTMVIAIISMWTWRIAFSYVLGQYFGLGVKGIWIAMTVDWLFRAICFTVRFIYGKSLKERRPVQTA
ncbi:MATE family efflux transporter [Konateibacter massiliensis]|uniref:MATE family efflux transporter n=1 Tax=Konateibacter massiliensis TaxID=2002841 RepID=UPI000C1500C8|nr:MATE family efflux transporter [Konateibacter massiliensis]